jgi:hypothetical protein
MRVLNTLERVLLNWYYVNDEWLYYKDGKKIKDI